MAVMKAEDAEEDKEQQGADGPQRIELVKPLIFWIGLLVFGLVLAVVVAPALGLAGLSQYSTELGQIASYIIYIPGSIILPLISSVWIGERVGSAGKKREAALRTGAINAIYTALVYAIAIFIIYLVLKYAGVQFISSVGLVPFLEYLVGIPVAITLVLIPLFSLLSSERRAT